MTNVETFIVCVDCYYYAANGHADDTTQERRAEIEKAFASYGPNLVAGDDLAEFSWRPCQLCESPLGGSRHEVHKLSPVKKCTVCNGTGELKKYAHASSGFTRPCWNCATPK